MGSVSVGKNYPSPIWHIRVMWFIPSKLKINLKNPFVPKNPGFSRSIPIWLVLSDEQMSNEWPFSLLNDEQMSNKVGVEHQPAILFGWDWNPTNPIRSGELSEFLGAALSAWASDTIEPSCFRTWTWYSSWPRSLEGEFVDRAYGWNPGFYGCFLFFFGFGGGASRGGGNQEVCNSKILDLFLFLFLPMVKSPFCTTI